MTAQGLLIEIFKNELVFDEEGNSYPLNSHLNWEEGIFLSKIIKEYRPESTIEIGCAYGMSSLFICSALEENSRSHHTIIDPSQKSVWKNIGVTNLKRAKIDFFKLIESPSEIALPHLLSEGKKYDFCFIDGWHTFDHTLIDFFYLDRLLKVGGIMVIDDVDLPGISKLLRYVLNYPSYKLIGNVPAQMSRKRKVFDWFMMPLRVIAGLLPTKIKYELFSGKVIKSDKKLNLRSSMAALKKIEVDERAWNWFKEF